MESKDSIKHTAKKGLLWGGFFSISSQLVSLFFSIIIARILQPSDFGLVAMLGIFTSLATVFQESGFVFVLTNRKNVTQEDYSTVFWFNITVSLFIYILFFFSAPMIADFYNQPVLKDLSRIVFLGFFFSSFGVVQSAYLYKNLKVYEKGIAGLVALIISGIAGYILAKRGFGYWGIALQGVLNVVITTIILWFYSPFRPRLVFSIDFLKESIPDCIRFAFPNLFSIVSENFYAVILGKSFSAGDVGLFNQATKINNAGSASILGMMRNVSQPVLVKVRDASGDALNAFRKLFRLSAFLSAFVLVSVSLVSQELIVLVFTDKWNGVSPILQILCFGGIAMILSTLFSYLVMSQNNSRVYMWMGIFSSILKIALLVIASLGGNVLWIALASIVTDIFYFVVYYIIVKKEYDYSLKNLFSDLGPLLIAAFFPYILLQNLSSWIHSDLTLLLVRLFLFSVQYLGICFLFRYDIVYEVFFSICNKIKRFRRM